MYSYLYYKRYITVKFLRNIYNPIKQYIEECIEDFSYYIAEYGFKEGIKQKLFPPMDEKTFVRKVINYELRNYPNIDYDYLISLPSRDHTKNKDFSPDKSFIPFISWYYLADIKNLYNLYHGLPLIEYQDNWVNRYTFKSEKEYLKFKKYYFKLYPKTKSWKVNKQDCENAFAWFNLNYGLAHEYIEKE